MDFSKIASFFSKKEEEIEQPRLPETAKDMYGDVSGMDAAEHEAGPRPPAIPDDVKDSPPKELPQLSFPSGRSKRPEEQAPGSKPEHRIVSESSESVPKMDTQIKEFENAVMDFYPNGYLERDTDGGSPTTVNDVGFFSEFQRFLQGNDLPSLANDIVSRDLLEKMKEYHAHREEGKPYYFHSREMEGALQEKMLELRNLERDWMTHKQRLSEEEQLLVQKEIEIGEHVKELKHIMEQIRKHDEFSQKADEESYFIMKNGQVLKSLSDLRSALRVMDEDVFRHHVDGERNDFAFWVRNVFDRQDLADALAGAGSREDMLKIMGKAEHS